LILNKSLKGKLVKIQRGPATVIVSFLFLYHCLLDGKVIEDDEQKPVDLPVF